ncbi:MAG: SpoIIE family protein phosphatase [Candidatus Competibacteraceae bacterium]
MTLRRRLFLLVTLLIVIGIPSTAGVFAYVSWQSVLARATQDGILVAQSLTQSIGLIQRVPITIEEIASKDGLTQADIVAHLTQIARQRGASTVEINRALQNIAARNRIPEIWVTDRRGTPIFWSLDDIDATIGVDSGLTQQSVFRPLLDGRKPNVSTDLLRRDLDGAELYYDGVALPDRRGMVLIAHLPTRFKEFINRIGLKRLMETVMSGALIDTIWVFNDALKPLAVTSVKGVDETTALTPTERDLVEEVITNSAPASRLEGDKAHSALFTRPLLYVAAPIFNTDGLPNGAALISLPIDMQAQINTLLIVGGGLTMLLLLSGMALALPFLNRIVRPLARLTVQTRRLVERDFKTDQEMLAELAEVAAKRRDEVGYLGGALSSMVTTLKTYIADLKETTAAKERIEGELSAAHSIQMGLLSQTFELPNHAECDLHAIVEPAKAVGGDLFDFFLLDEHRLFCLIGDVSDKGVPAALFMAVTKTLFTAEAQRDSTSVGHIVERVNTALCKHNPECMFVTVFAGILDLDSGEITYSDGGHERPFVLRHSGDVVMIEKQGGLALGCVAEAKYKEGLIRLAPGDGLVLYTDGVSEAMNAKNELFQARRLSDALAVVGRECSARMITDQVICAVKAFVGHHPQNDDMTLLALRWRGPTGTADLLKPKTAHGTEITS